MACLGPRSEEDVSKSKRVGAVLREIRARAGSRNDDAGAAVPAAELASWRVHIISRNTFPTAAGLASSAAGYACLVDTLADVYAVKEETKGDLTAVARQGSGSACRSMYGGFVRWEMGSADDGRDSIAVQVADESHWPELVVLVAVVSDKKKDTGSTEGMKISVETSELLAHRATKVVPARLAAIEDAYRRRDFETFARITMQDSNQFHAVCLDTFPPIFYMNDTSKRIIGLVHAFNESRGKIAAGYTFDAGPNAVIYTTRDVANEMLSVLLAHFPDPRSVAPERQPAGYVPYLPSGEYVSDAAAESEAREKIPGLTGKLACAPGAEAVGAVRYFYVTSVGDGPRTLSAEASLADSTTGLPLATADGAAGDYAKAL
jgi:diphosphomevalonate decarboxylase